MALISVTKCHGTGNDFVLLDARAIGQQLAYPEIARTYPEIARRLCLRRISIGADGLLVVRDPQTRAAHASMLTFNPDGSEAEMCGNGIRCVARYLYEENHERTESLIETIAGLMQTKIVSWDGKPGVQVAMGEPEFLGGSPGRLDGILTVNGESAHAYAVSMGNPHIVVFASRDPSHVELEHLAAAAAGWKAFDAQPNFELAQVAGGEIRMRVWERGAGETWACGTGACAAAAVAIALGRTESPVTVTTKGGSVRVSWQGAGHGAFMTGNAELVFRTEVDVRA